MTITHDFEPPLTKRRFRLIVAGGRDFIDFNRLAKICSKILNDHPTLTIVSGTARGADQIGEKWAELNYVPVDRYPAEWDVHGKSAGYIRNLEMADNADAVLVFWDGKSRGTKHMIDIAKEKGLPLKIIRYES